MDKSKGDHLDLGIVGIRMEQLHANLCRPIVQPSFHGGRLLSLLIRKARLMVASLCSKAFCAPPSRTSNLLIFPEAHATADLASSRLSQYGTSPFH